MTATAVDAATLAGGDAVRGHAAHAYRPHLDGIRALAVVAVICFHLGFGWIPGGFVGVDVFFVLSGYLITGLLFDEVNERSTVRLGRFYARRVRRLLPASIAVLAVVAVVGARVLDLVQQRSLGWDLTFASLYSANWRFAFVGGDYFAPGDVPSPLVHYWSLAVEEQFYLVWPALLLILHKVARRLRGDRWPAVVVAGIAALTVASLAASLMLTGRPSAYYGTHTRAYQLLAGGLLVAALRWRSVGTFASRAARFGAGAGTIGAVAVLAVIAHSTPDAIGYPGSTAVAVTLASLVLIAAVDLVPSGAAARALGAPPAAATGRLSYSLYIWHWPVIVLVPVMASQNDWSAIWQNRLVQVVLTVVIAIASYLLVERPARFRLVPSARPMPVVALGLASSIAVAAIVYPIFQPTSAFERRVLDAATDYAPIRPCPYSRADWPADAADAEPCVALAGTPGGRVIAVVGDSHAHAWTPAIEILAAREEATVVRITRRACTPVDVTPTLRTDTNQLVVDRECTEWRRSVFPKLVAEYDPDLIIVANRSHVRDIETDGRRYEVGDPGHLEAWAAGWDWTLDTLTAGTGTVVVATILPTLPWRMPACLAAAGKDTGCDVAVADDPAVVPFNEVIRGFDGGHGGDVRVVDQTGIPCPDGTCQAIIGDTIVFRDDNHLSATFAREHATDLADAFAEIGVPI